MAMKFGLKKKHSEGEPFVLIHIHIQKSAGRSLNTMLRKVYPENSQVDASHQPIHLKIQDMDQCRRKEISLVAGHCLYGVHKLFPQRAVYLCILREPVSRLFSLYKYIARTEHHPVHAKLTEVADGFGGFLEFVQEVPGLLTEVHSGQMRRIAGNMSPKFVGKEQELFDAAVEHLAAPNMRFGFTEDFERYVRGLVSEGLVPPLEMVRVNSSPPGSDLEEVLSALTPDQKTLLNRYVYWDLKLYEAALRIQQQSR
tara:strand:+ start:14326 stop:15090 length:765 start_codon:yes stop_codon:yes gene_type:complete